MMLLLFCRGRGSGNGGGDARVKEGDRTAIVTVLMMTVVDMITTERDEGLD